MAPPKKFYVYAIIRRDFVDDKDKKGVTSLFEIHDSVDSAYAATKEAAGDPEDEHEETETKDGLATIKNKERHFSLQMKKVELKGDADGDGQG